MVIIRSKRFILRSFKKGDEASLIESVNNKAIARNTLRIPYPYKLKDARWWINHNLKLDRKKKKIEINFAIEADKKLVGCIGLDKIYGHSAEIGYWLGEKYWGQGIMTKAVKLVTKYGFEKLGLVRVYAFIFLFNKVSKNVLKNSGFKYEGKLRKCAKKGSKFLDCLLFAKVR
jgi:ribosomal-protein-alanine N-acetyltransferase